MRTVLPSVLSVSLAALLLSACSGSGSSGSSPFDNTRPPTKINGLLDSSVAANAKHKADIFAVPINTQGQPSQSNAGGFIGKHTKAKTNGEYETEFDGQYVNQPGLLIAYPLGLEGENADSEFIYTAAIGTVLFDGFGRGANMQVNINWITSLAADFAYTSYIDENGAEGNNPNKAMPGIYSVYTIERANLWLSKQFDLPDVVSTTPILPNQLNQFGHLASQERSNGIRYGALLAAGRSLAESGKYRTEWEWFEKVRDQQRDLLGQLYQNADDEFSLCQLYTKAAASLSGVSAPQEAMNQYTYLSGKAFDYCATENVYEPTDIDVPFEEIEAWANVTVDAKNFLTDLNDRLNNIKGDDPHTCGKGDSQWSSEIQSNPDCMASFFDPAYIKQAEDFYGPMQSLYEDHKEEFKQAQQDLIDSVLAFTRCLNASKPCTEYKKGGLTFTLEPYEELKQGNEYYAFVFVISGTQSITDTDTDTADNEIAKITYKTATLNDADKTLLKPRVRVVYEDAYATPPVTVMADKKAPETVPTGGVEALGYDFNFPHLIIDNFAGNSLETLFSAKLIGVKPHSFEDTSAAHPYHYNYTELVMQSDIKDNNESKSRINIVIRTANGADFYAQEVWPDLEDLFQEDGGEYYYDANKAGADIMDESHDTITDLFEYTLAEKEQVVLTYRCADGKAFDDSTFKCSDKVSEPQPSYVTADYFEITPKGLGTNRYELYADETTSGKRLRNCAIPADVPSEEAEKNKVCTQSEWFYPEFKIEDLLKKNDDGSYEYFSLFAFPGYGAYEPQFPEKIAEIAASGSVDGDRKLHYSHTLNDFSLLLDQRFNKSPLAIAKVNFSKRTPTSWEVALSIGYDYNPEYRDAMESWGIWQTQGVLALGEKAQSLYFSYFVNDTTEEGAANQSFTELSGLMVYRGAVKLSGTATGHSLTIAGNKNYQTTGTELDIEGCGYLFANKRKDHDNFDQGCENNEVAYLTFRSALIGVIREETKDQYVARFSDGTAVAVDFMESLPGVFLDPLHGR